MFGTILAIASIIITIILGYYGIILTKKTKQLTKLEFKRNACFTLFDSAIDKLKIDITYSDKKIKNPLILFKGVIENSGTTDIDKTSIYKPIIITTNKYFEWLEINLINTGSETNSTIEILNKNDIRITWDLLKKGEKIEFQALIEAEIKNEKLLGNDNLVSNFYNSLKFESRITNLEKIDCNDKYSNEITSDLNTNFLIIVSIITLVSSFALGNFSDITKDLITSKDYVNINFEIQQKTSDTIMLAQIYSIKENEIILKDEQGNKTYVPEKLFNNFYQIKDIKSTKKSLTAKLIQGFFFLALISSLLSITTIIIKKIGSRKKIKNKLIDSSINLNDPLNLLS